MSLDEFDDVAQAAYKAELSSITGVSPGLIDLTVTAASVHVVATFLGLDTVAADIAVASLSTAINRSQGGGSFGGFPTTSEMPITVSTALDIRPAPSPPPPSPLPPPPPQPLPPPPERPLGTPAPRPPPPWVAEATPAAKAAHFAAKTAVVAAAARASVSSFAEADEVTQNETVSSVARTYETLHQDVANGASLAELLDLQLDACVGGAPTVDNLNWSFHGAVSHSDQHLPCTNAPTKRSPCSHVTELGCLLLTMRSSSFDSHDHQNLMLTYLLT